MHLLAPLISGVQNAGNGSAAIHRRGTSTLATLYSSFEGDSFASSSLDNNDRVILDSYGRAQVYVDEVVDVSVYAEDGTLQITFTAGVAASAVEVRSQSFTGNAYDMSAANTVGQPTSLQAVLDLWITVQSQADWGLSASASSPFVIVTDPAYGAEGDGVTDDTDAITAAIAAAGAGGVVFFPAGNYRVTGTLTVSMTSITFLGVGTRTTTSSSRILLDAANDSLIMPGVASQRLTIVGMSLEASQANTASIIDTTDAILHTLRLFDCVIGDTATGYSDGNVVLMDPGHSIEAVRCTFTLGGDASNGLWNSGGYGSCKLTACIFGITGATTYAGDGFVTGNNIYATDCFFTPSHTGGELKCIRFNTGSGTMAGAVRGCTFAVTNTGTGDTVGMDLATPNTSSVFVESGNNFPVATQYSTRAFTAYEYGGTFSQQIRLMTRETRVILITDNTTPVEIPTDQYGTVILSSTHAAPEIDGVLPPEGATGTVFLYHPSGGAGTATLDQHFFGDSAPSGGTANTSTHVWQYVCANMSGTLRMMITVDGRAVGNGA